MNNDVEKQFSEICPFLGLKNDPSTSVGYPSAWNVCFHSKNRQTPNLQYQKSICITNHYLDCSIYRSEIEKQMPKSIRHQTGQSFFKSKWVRYLIIILTSFIVVLLIFAFSRQLTPSINGFFIPAWQKTQQVLTYQPMPTDEFSGIPEIDMELTATPTFIPSLTPVPVVEVSPTNTLIPSTLALDTPIGGSVKFVIHQTLPGESLEQFSRKFNTTVEAIRAINFDLPSVLYVDRIVVIPVDIQDPSDLPVFDVYHVTMRGLSVDQIAEQLGTNPEDLSKYNNVPVDYIFTNGEWILVPRE